MTSICWIDQHVKPTLTVCRGDWRPCCCNAPHARPTTDAICIAHPSFLVAPQNLQSWSTYQKLLATDFLEHRTLYAALRELLLRERGAAPSSPPLAWLDLGCGDAEQAAAALHACGAPAGALALASYTGVDVSAPALAGAAVNLAFLQPKCSVSLVEVRWPVPAALNTAESGSPATSD
jgi:SAM-dependent methyltransferase